jgi:hypothetical protein
MAEDTLVMSEVWEHPVARALAPLSDQEVRDKVESEWIDVIEAIACNQPQVDCPLEHVFTPGLRPGEWIYSRKILMRRGLLITSKIHRTEHQFVVSKGRCEVWTPDGSSKIIEAGHHGVTEAGTRRLLLIYEDTVWTTFHPVFSQDLRVIEEQVIVPHDFNAGKNLTDQQLALQIAGQSESFRKALKNLTQK